MDMVADLYPNVFSKHPEIKDRTFDETAAAFADIYKVEDDHDMNADEGRAQLR